MTMEEAIRILDPETTAEALAEIEYYAGLRGKEAEIKAVEDACILAVAAIREQERRRLIPVTERPKWKGCYIVVVKHWVDGKPVAREAFWNGCDLLSFDKKRELTPRVTHWMPLPEAPNEDV